MKATGKKPYFTAKTVAGLLAGDNQCHASAWIKSRFWYTKQPSSFDFVLWREQHGVLVERRRGELQALGYDVTIENQNKYQLQGATAILTGKPDLVAFKSSNVLVSDGKTGTQRETDFWQVLIYMACVKLAQPERYADVPVTGEIVYPHGVIEIPSTDLTEERKAAIFRKIRELARDQPFPTTPSAQECMFCDIGDCTDRMAAEAATAVTEF